MRLKLAADNAVLMQRSAELAVRRSINFHGAAEATRRRNKEAAANVGKALEEGADPVVAARPDDYDDPIDDEVAQPLAALLRVGSVAPPRDDDDDEAEAAGDEGCSWSLHRARCCTGATPRLAQCGAGAECWRGCQWSSRSGADRPATPPL